MTEREIKLMTSRRLAAGELKSDLFFELKDQLEEKSLRAILAARPSYLLQLKYKVEHLVLSIIWGLFILVELTGIIGLFIDFDLKYLITLVLSIYIAINIWKFDGRFFLPGIIWFAFSIFNAFGELYANFIYEPDFKLLFTIMMIYSAVLVIGIYLMYQIKRNVFSYFKWFKPDLNFNDEISYE